MLVEKNDINDNKLNCNNTENFDNKEKICNYNETKVYDSDIISVDNKISIKDQMINCSSNNNIFCDKNYSLEYTNYDEKDSSIDINNTNKNNYTEYNITNKKNENSSNYNNLNITNSQTYKKTNTTSVINNETETYIIHGDKSLAKNMSNNYTNRYLEIENKQKLNNKDFLRGETLDLNLDKIENELINNNNNNNESKFINEIPKSLEKQISLINKTNNVSIKSFTDLADLEIKDKSSSPYDNTVILTPKSKFLNSKSNVKNNILKYTFIPNNNYNLSNESMQTFKIGLYSYKNKLIKMLDISIKNEKLNYFSTELLLKKYYFPGSFADSNFSHKMKETCNSFLNFINSNINNCEKNNQYIDINKNTIILVNITYYLIDNINISNKKNNSSFFNEDNSICKNSLINQLKNYQYYYNIKNVVYSNITNNIYKISFKDIINNGFKNVLANCFNDINIESFLFISTFGSKEDIYNFVQICYLSKNKEDIYLNNSIPNKESPYYVFFMIKSNKSGILIKENLNYIKNNFFDILIILLENCNKDSSLFEEKSIIAFYNDIINASYISKKLDNNCFGFIEIYTSMILLHYFDEAYSTNKIYAILDNYNNINSIINRFLSVSSYEKLFYSEIMCFILYRTISNFKTNDNEELQKTNNIIKNIAFTSILIKFKFILLSTSEFQSINYLNTPINVFDTHKEYDSYIDKIKDLAKTVYNKRNQFGSICNNKYFDNILKNNLLNINESKKVLKDFDIIDVVNSNKEVYTNDKNFKTFDFVNNNNNDSSKLLNNTDGTIKKIIEPKDTFSNNESLNKAFIEDSKNCNKLLNISKESNVFNICEIKLDKFNNKRESPHYNVLDTNINHDNNILSFDLNKNDQGIIKSKSIDDDNKNINIEAEKNIVSEGLNLEKSADIKNNKLSYIGKIKENLDSSNNNSIKTSIYTNHQSGGSFFINALGFLYNRTSKNKILVDDKNTLLKENEDNKNNENNENKENSNNDVYYDASSKRWKIRGKIYDVEEDKTLSNENKRQIILPPKSKETNKDEPKETKLIKEENNIQENFFDKKPLNNPFDSGVKKQLIKPPILTKKPAQKYANFLNNNK